MTVIFISDIHLTVKYPTLTSCFIQFIEEQAVHGSHLYILGDLFEAWVGDDNNAPLVQEITTVLKKLSQTTQIFIMPGNRDFLMGERFTRKCGATLLTDPAIIDLHGTPTLLTHGDLLCTNDRAYQRWRSVVHWQWLQRLFLSLPLAWRLMVAKKLRASSKAYVKNLSVSNMDVVPQTVINIMRQYKVKQLIHGHTHQPTIHYLNIDNQPAWHYVLSDWHNAATALIVKPQQLFYLLPPK
jgi:UDP-2,3-diacylglucosamine hydrolase